jgi:hypothetical protein
MASASSQVAIGRAMNGAEILFSVGLFGVWDGAPYGERH